MHSHTLAHLNSILAAVGDRSRKDKFREKQMFRLFGALEAYGRFGRMTRREQDEMTRVARMLLSQPRIKPPVAAPEES